MSSPCKDAYLDHGDDIAAIITVSWRTKNASFVLSSLTLQGSQGGERVPSSDLGGQVISISHPLSPSLPPSLPLALTPADMEQSECCVQSRMQLAYAESEAIHFFDESLVLLLFSSSSSSSSYDLLSHFRSSSAEVLKLDRPTFKSLLFSLTARGSSYFEDLKSQG